MAATDGDPYFLLIRCGQRTVAIDLAQVGETMRPLPVESLADAPPCVLGISLIRGMPTPVLDAAALLSMDEATVRRRQFNRFVTLRLAQRRTALAVDGVLDVRRLSHESLVEVPPLLRGAATERLAALGVLDQALVTVLDTARLLPDAVWDGFSAPRASA